MIKEFRGLRQTSFRAFGIVIATTLAYGSAPIGFSGLVMSASDAIAQIAQSYKPRPHHFADRPGPVFRGTNPGRDPYGRGGMWTPQLVRDLMRVRADEMTRRTGRLSANMNGSFGPLMPPGGGDPGGGGGGGEGGSGGGGPSSQLNTNTGNRLSHLPLVSWPGPGGSGVDFTLYHNSMVTYISDIGAGWSHSYDVKVDYTGALSAIVRWHDGFRVPYTEFEGIFDAPAGWYNSLVHNVNGTWTLTTTGQRVFNFDVDGRLASIFDRFGNSVTIARDASGNPTTVMDQTFRQLTFAYGANGLISSVTDPLSRVWSFSYNASDQLTGVTYPALNAVLHTRSFTYDANDNMLTETDLKGNVWSWTYDAENRETGYTDPLGNTRSFGYTDTAATITDPLGNTVTHNYSGGLIASIVDAAGFSDAYVYDADRNVTSYTDRRGKVSTATYDSNGNTLTFTDPLGRTNTRTYNANNDVTTYSNSLNQTTTVAYGGNGLAPTAVTDPLARTVVTATFDSQGDCLTVTDALGHTFSAAYDTNKNISSITYTDGTTKSATYNNLGGMVAFTDTTGATSTFLYDEWARAISTTSPDLSILSLVYDLETHLVSATDQIGRTAYTTFDAAGRTTSTTSARGDSQSYTYNTASWLTSVTNGRGYTRTFAHTTRGEVSSLTHADSRVESWAYDANGDPVSYTNPLNQTVTYTRNDAGQQTMIDYPTGTDTTFTFDGAGRTISMTDSTGVSSWVFNAAGEVTQVATPQGTLQYLYDTAGKATQVTDVGTGVTTFSYDQYGRFASLTNPFGETTSVQYDNVARTNRKNLPNGMYVTATFDVMSRLTSIKTYNSTNVLQDTKSYVWDAASRVTSATEGGVAATYGYDAINQLISESRPSLGYSAAYTYDSNGNRLSRTVNSVTETYSYDSADKLLSITGGTNPRTFTYDTAGQTKTIVNGSGTTSYSYDYDGRVTQIIYPALTSDSFTYNGIGARTSTSGVNGARTFHRTGIRVTSRVLSDGTKDFTPGVSSRENGTSTFQHSGLKNTHEQTNASETTTASRVYDAFGNIISSSGTWQGPYGYAGQFGYHEDGNNLKLLGHRYYNTDTGRFITSDPIRDGRNWYGYVNNNPVSSADPDGLQTHDPKVVLWDPIVDFYHGTLGEIERALDKYLSPNENFLRDFIFGGGDTYREYGEDSQELNDMRNSPGADALREQFYEQGDLTKGFYDTWPAFRDTIWNPRSIALHVGGFGGATATDNGDGTVTFRIKNLAGMESFFYHRAENKKSDSGPFRTITEVFTWTEEIVEHGSSIPRPPPPITGDPVVPTGAVKMGSHIAWE